MAQKAIDANGVQVLVDASPVYSPYDQDHPSGCILTIKLGWLDISGLTWELSAVDLEALGLGH